MFLSPIDIKLIGGGLNHLKAILLLAEESLKNGQNSFFHLITGEDFPIKRNIDFEKLDITKNYLEYFKLPSDVWSGNGGLDRLDYFQPYDHLNAKSKFQFTLIKLMINFQRLMKTKRKLPEIFPENIYGGSTYWSLNRESLKYVSEKTELHNKILNRLKFTFCPEEFFFQTMIMNSPFADETINDNLRFIDWESGRGGVPAFLDENDFEKIISSGKYFARKISKDSRIKKMMIDYLRQDPCNS